MLSVEPTHKKDVLDKKTMDSSFVAMVNDQLIKWNIRTNIWAAEPFLGRPPLVHSA
jgi:hypothetical protein